MNFLVSIALKLFSGSTLSFVSGVVKNLSDTHAAVVASQTGLATEQTKAVVSAEIARQNVVGSLMMAMMSHPIWWIAWCLFVLPVGIYDALIHLKSILCPFLGSACQWDILRVPATQESWDMYVVLSFFGIFAASGVVTSIAKMITVPR